jgi:diphosphomevalonate decarboxylase
MKNLRSKWRSPSNIALIKYWGKYANQIPANPSISFTLDKCHTQTEVVLQDKTSDEDYSFNIHLDEELQPGFKPKIKQFFERIAAEAPWLKEYHLEIRTHNSFPHSSGIASSASGMSALSLCLLDIQNQLHGHEKLDHRQASMWSRLGSGSASRSVYGGLVEWGQYEGISNSSDEYAVPYQGAIHEEFKSFRDYILLVETGSKSVSSSAGHGLMTDHPYAQSRFAQAHHNMDELLKIISSGNLEAFGELVESEALTLHAMMMTSRPYFILMKPNTLKIIESIWRFRNETRLPVYFTLDAGANIHLLFPASVETRVDTFLQQEIQHLLKGGRYIKDNVGSGPAKLS